MTDRVGSVETEYHLPCAEALLAGILALMTGHAQSECPGRQARMAERIVENIEALAQHAAFSAQFRMALHHLRTHWQGLADPGPCAPAAAPDPGPRLLH